MKKTLRKLILLLIILISGYGLKAQTNLDSLYSVWQNQSEPDSIRATAFLRYIWRGYLYTKPDSAYILVSKLQTFVKDNDIKKLEGTCLYIQGLSYSFTGNAPKALVHFDKALQSYDQMDNQYGKGNVLTAMGHVYENKGNNSKALRNYTQTLDIMEKLGNQSGISLALIAIGDIYNLQGNADKALEYFNRCLTIKEQLGEQRGIANSMDRIGSIYLDKGNFPKALDFYTRCLHIRKKINAQYGIGYSYEHLGSLYAKQGNYQKALEYYNQGLHVDKAIDNQSNISRALTNIGKMHKELGDFRKAKEFCKQGYDVALTINDLKIQQSACNCLYQVYKQIGDGNKALIYHELIMGIDDSLNLGETIKQLERMEFAKQVLADSLANVEEARLVKEAHQEQVRKGEKTRNIIIGFGILILIVAAGLYGRVRYIRKSKAALQTEKDRSENLLLNILPADIAEELKLHGKAEARDFDMVSILFTDFKGFTAASEKLSAADLVNEINTCFEAFDHIMSKYNIEKIKTIGDAYMAASGLPVFSDDSIKNAALAALEMQEFIRKRKAEMDKVGKPAFEMRVGIHTGPVVAGIVGVKKFQYDIWGDTVNTASRMESSGEVGKVNISQATYELLSNDASFNFESRGKIQAKGKGEIQMYFVSMA